MRYKCAKETNDYEDASENWYIKCKHFPVHKISDDILNFFFLFFPRKESFDTLCDLS